MPAKDGFETTHITLRSWPEDFFAFPPTTFFQIAVYILYLSELFVTTNKAFAIASRVTPLEHPECVIPRCCASFYRQRWFKTAEDTNIIP